MIRSDKFINIIFLKVTLIIWAIEGQYNELFAFFILSHLGDSYNVALRKCCFTKYLTNKTIGYHIAPGWLHQSSGSAARVYKTILPFLTSMTIEGSYKRWIIISLKRVSKKILLLFNDVNDWQKKFTLTLALFNMWLRLWRFDPLQWSWPVTQIQFIHNIFYHRKKDSLFWKHFS